MSCSPALFTWGVLTGGMVLRYEVGGYRIVATPPKKKSRLSNASRMSYPDLEVSRNRVTGRESATTSDDKEGIPHMMFEDRPEGLSTAARTRLAASFRELQSTAVPASARTSGLGQYGLGDTAAWIFTLVQHPRTCNTMDIARVSLPPTHLT